MANELKFEDELVKGIDELNKRIAAALLMKLATEAEVLRYKMQSNRPWTDRTGMAKATLTAKVSRPKPELFRTTLAHGVDYGVWLELANEKNYAIIQPTILQEGPGYFESLKGFIDKLK